MRRTLAAVLFMALGGALTVVAFGFHFVRSPRSDFVIWKWRPSLNDVYVDVRKWDAAEWRKHPDLAKSIRQAGKDDIIPKPEPTDPIQRLLRKFRGRNDDSPQDTPPNS